MFNIIRIYNTIDENYSLTASSAVVQNGFLLDLIFMLITSGCFRATRYFNLRIKEKRGLYL